MGTCMYVDSDSRTWKKDVKMLKGRSHSSGFSYFN